MASAMHLFRRRRMIYLLRHRRLAPVTQNYDERRIFRRPTIRRTTTITHLSRGWVSFFAAPFLWKAIQISDIIVSELIHIRVYLRTNQSTPSERDVVAIELLCI